MSGGCPLQTGAPCWRFPLWFAAVGYVSDPKKKYPAGTRQEKRPRPRPVRVRLFEFYRAARVRSASAAVSPNRLTPCPVGKNGSGRGPGAGLMTSKETNAFPINLPHLPVPISPPRVGASLVSAAALPSEPVRRDARRRRAARAASSLPRGLAPLLRVCVGGGGNGRGPDARVHAVESEVTRVARAGSSVRPPPPRRAPPLSIRRLAGPRDRTPSSRAHGAEGSDGAPALRATPPPPRVGCGVSQSPLRMVLLCTGCAPLVGDRMGGATRAEQRWMGGWVARCAEGGGSWIPGFSDAYPGAQIRASRRAPAPTRRAVRARGGGRMGREVGPAFQRCLWQTPFSNIGARWAETPDQTTARFPRPRFGLFDSWDHTQITYKLARLAFCVFLVTGGSKRPGESGLRAAHRTFPCARSRRANYTDGFRS
eukprot:gene19138-biopygen6960